MLSFQVLLLNEPCSDEMRQATKNSMATAFSETLSLVECEQPQMASIIEASTAEVIHIIMAGTILLPDFYRAMLTTLEQTNKDYAVCHEVALSLRSIVKAGDVGFNFSQAVVRRWVYQEIGVESNAADLVNKVIGEYRGCEVPHVLCVRN